MKTSFSYKLLLLSISACFTLFSQAQYTKYIIKFRNKANSPYSLNNPSQYLSPKAIERRIRYSIAIDSLDLPVNPSYIESVIAIGNIKLLNQSKWLNQIAIQTSNPSIIAQIELLPFVESSKPIAARTSLNQLIKLPENNQAARPFGNTGNAMDYGLSNSQIRLHQGQFLHNHGFRGEDMLITLLDCGFKNYDVIPTFDSARKNKQIKGTWDFVAGDTSVAEDDSHGTWCFSSISANMPGIFTGTAPKASYYLFRTEDVFSEYPIEEQNLAAGAERADSLGTDICSISLGYSTFDNPAFDYKYEDLNGNTTISARAVNIGAKKGMLMVVAAGNDGNKSWKYIATPGDAKEALTVGAVDTLGKVAGFSGYGPASDGSIKPSVAAVGAGAVVADATTGMPFYSNGTSFACPNMAGLASCLWQAFPEVDNMEIRNILQQSGSIFSNPDDRMGYGIPDVKKAFVMLQKKFYKKNFYLSLCKSELSISLKSDSTVTIELERKLQNETDFTTVSSKKIKDKFDYHQYHFSDDLTGIISNMLSYRIKVIIEKDTTYYLDNYAIPYDNRCATVLPASNKISIAPNPVKDKLNIKIEQTKEVIITIDVFNSAGQQLYTEKYKHLPGTFTRSLDFSNYINGVYFIRIIDGNKVQAIEKIVK